MAWDHLAINKPHLVYIILGGFTSLFMLCSSIIKERLYIGEATVATLVGVIFGPHAANLINPLQWGNTDQITLEFSRIVLVVQCFAVGVELPKYYMEKHWRSIVFLLVPVMTFGWLITSLFIWAVFYEHANWLDSLCMAACVTATDPVLASSVVGKGKFAKRVPKHLRDILSAESGCNDGMAFPFIYLALYIIKYKHQPSQVALHWFCITILYECIFGAIYGVLVGYIARRLIRFAHERDYIDRESFLVFYFVLALFCAGSGSLLGMDDLLIGFACGVGFSNDGWFSEKTEEAHVSNVIDLLLNLAFFVYFGAIIPWDQFNAGYLGLDVWRFVVIAILVVFFRRIPAMMALKPLIPDIKTWREALFAGHFGPIGVGAIFVSILARADLEEGPQDGATPLASIPPVGFAHRNIIVLIWPITTFLVITSILVHGSSVAVFTLGKHINTLALTFSYSRGRPDAGDWMDRLPRIQSRSKSSMSIQRSESSMDNEKQVPRDQLPLASAGQFLRRQRESENPSRSSSRHRRLRNWDSGRGPGGPISQSAIGRTPRQRSPVGEKPERSDSDTLALKSDSPPSSQEKEQRQEEDRGRREAEQGREDVASPAEIYEEGPDTVYEDKDGEVLAVESNPEGENKLEREVSEIEESRRLGRERSAEGIAPDEPAPEESPDDSTDMKYDAGNGDRENRGDVGDQPSEQAAKSGREGAQKFNAMGLFKKREKQDKRTEKKPARRDSAPSPERTPARAYQYGNTIILEDEDGEVIKKYDIPAPEGQQGPPPGSMRERLGSVSKKLGLGAIAFGGKDGKAQPGAPGAEASGSAAAGQTSAKGPSNNNNNNNNNDDDDHLVRFTMGGRRMSKVDFIESFRDMEPNKRLQAVEESDAPESTKREVRREAREQSGLVHRPSRADVPVVHEHSDEEQEADTQGFYSLGRTHTADENEMHRMQSNTGEVPWHDVSRDLRRHQIRGRDGEETAAERRRRLALQQQTADSDSDDDGTERVPPFARAGSSHQPHGSLSERHETAAERRRRLGALGQTQEQDSDSEEDDQPRQLPQSLREQADYFSNPPAAAAPTPRQRTLRWASNVGRKQ